MAKSNKKTIDSNTELLKLIEDTKKMRTSASVRVPYNPTTNLIVNGTEIVNYLSPGFPKFNDLKLVLEKSSLNYKPLLIITDTSLRYLLAENELPLYEQAVNEGLKIKSMNIKIQEVKDYEQIIEELVKQALDKNAKILSNEDVLQTFELVHAKQEHFNNKKYLVQYTIKSTNEIAIFEH